MNISFNPFESPCWRLWERTVANDGQCKPKESASTAKLHDPLSPQLLRSQLMFQQADEPGMHAFRSTLDHDLKAYPIMLLEMDGRQTLPELHTVSAGGGRVCTQT